MSVAKTNIESTIYKNGACTPNTSTSSLQEESPNTDEDEEEKPVILYGCETALRIRSDKDPKNGKGRSFVAHKNDHTGI
uniref:Uncharacterized protein n=1 Tax=Steinernema glaseri TaxID=37863 RepID=A0A1I8ASS3_9BILA